MRTPLFSFLLSCLLATCCQSYTMAQAPSGSLRPHIVKTVNESGQDEYRDDRTPSIPDTSIWFIYVGQKQNGPLWLRMQVRHASFKQLFMEKIMFHKGERQLLMPIDPMLYHTGDNGMISWEWYDSPVSETDLKVITAIINEPGVELTLIGRESTVSRVISETEREAMQNVLEQARVLGRVPKE